MAIRPMDLQVNIQHSSNVLKSNANMANRADTAAHQFSEMLNQKTEEKMQQVAKSEQAEQNNVNKDGRGGAAYGGNSKKKQKDKDSKAEEKKPNPYGSQFDFTI